MLATWWTKDGLVMLFPANIANLNLPLVERIDVDGVVFLFAAATSVIAGLLFGILPAWNVARSNLQGALKDGERGGSGSRRTHTVLVISEVALSIVLLAGALLMVQSFMRVQKLQFGFESDQVMTARVILPDYRYSTPAKMAAFTRDLLPRLQSIPGVDSAAIVNYLPLSGWSGWQDFTIEGRPPVTGAAAPSSSFQAASEDYFRTMGIQVKAGRTFTPRDNDGAPRVAVVNQSLAQRYWPGQNPIGQRILVPTDSRPLTIEIVGVVADIRANGLEEPAEAELYVPLAQNPAAILGMVLKSKVDPASLTGQLRAAVWSVDPEQPVTFEMPMRELTSESLAFRRAGMILAGAFGALALVLAAIGIFGVLSYSVSRRTREIGIRMALGASRAEVATRIMREGLVMTAAGIAIGLAAALALSRFMSSVLFEVKPGDPLTYIAVAVILLTVAALATLIPARRATGVDPLVALRAD
jgi:putative ABC transport system permease protein